MSCNFHVRIASLGHIKQSRIKNYTSVCDLNLMQRNNISNEKIYFNFNAAGHY